MNKNMFKITIVVGVMVLAMIMSTVVTAETFAGDTVSDDLPSAATSEDDNDYCPPGKSPDPAGSAAAAAAAGVEMPCFSDLDDDGILDKNDNCPIDTNPNQEIPLTCKGIVAEKDCPPGQSRDPDSVPSAADVGVCYSDLDDDGILDKNDNCPIDTNPNQEIPLTCKGIVAEKDFEGKMDNANVPRILGENVIPADLPNQADSNPDPEEDLFPESCEGAPGCDDDQDGVPDTEDNCPKSPNSDQGDSDGDGIGDSCQSIPEEPADPPPTPQCAKRTDHWDPNTGTCVPTFGEGTDGGASTNEPPRPLSGETDGTGSTGGVIEDPDLPPPVILRSDGQRQSTTGGNSATQGIGQSQSQLPVGESLPDACPDGTEPKSTGTGGTVPKCLPVKAEQPATDQSEELSEEQLQVPELETQNDKLQQSPEEDNSEGNSEDNSEGNSEDNSEGNSEDNSEGNSEDNSEDS